MLLNWSEYTKRRIIVRIQFHPELFPALNAGNLVILKYRTLKMSFRKLYYTLSPGLRRSVRRLVYAPVDVWELLAGRRDVLTPPRGLIYTGSGDFRRQGRQFLEYYIEYGGLRPYHRVLDVGSGIGRMAVPLTGYLSERGSYEGFDVVEAGVKWCARHISSRFPNFRFRYIPLKNDLYTSEGEEASDLIFPYPDNEFDFIFLTSVFTHLLPEQVEHYLREIRRVLRPEGRVLATFFLITNGAEATRGRKSAFAFPYDHGYYRLMDREVRSANVAYREDWLRKTAKEAGLGIERVLYGYWSRGIREEGLDFQDMVVLAKED